MSGIAEQLKKKYPEVIRVAVEELDIAKKELDLKNPEGRNRLYDRIIKRVLDGKMTKEERRYAFGFVRGVIEKIKKQKKESTQEYTIKDALEDRQMQEAKELQIEDAKRMHGEDGWQENFKIR